MSKITVRKTKTEESISTSEFENTEELVKRLTDELIQHLTTNEVLEIRDAIIYKNIKSFSFHLYWN